MIRRAPASIGKQRQVATLSLSSNNKNSSTSEEYSHKVNSFWVAASAALVSGSAVATAFLEEAEERQDNPTTANASLGEEEEEEDPYENLPEDDEPTDCSMCNTFRKGPCRQYWRKLERCFKDHEGQEDGAQNCMRYFMPHQKCLMNYTNLYNLVRLTSLQEYIDETEEALPANQRGTMDLPLIDWSLWREFQSDAGSNYSQGLEKSSYTKRTPLHERFAENTEPVVLTFAVQIPREDDKDGLLLRFAYVVDQDGMVLGVESNPQYRFLRDEVEGRKRDGGDDNTNKEEENDIGPEMKFDFYIIPSMTQQIKLKAMYAKDPRTPGLKGDGSDDVLKEAPPVQLSQVS